MTTHSDSHRPDESAGQTVTVDPGATCWHCQRHRADCPDDIIDWID